METQAETKQTIVPKIHTYVVVCKYKKNVDFAYRINNGKGIYVIVYDKENPKDIPLNKGNEASVYLKYICDFYDCLPKYTYFIHDEEYAWHHSGSVVDKYRESILSGKEYYNINDKCCWEKELEGDVLEYYKLWSKEVLGMEYDGKGMVGQRGSAQFLVSRERIRLHSRELYIRLYMWIMNTKESNYWSGRMLEYTWHRLWSVV